MRLAVYLLFGLTLTGAWACRSSNQPEFLLRASLLVAEDHTWFRAFQHFGELLEERSEGRIVLQTYPSEQLAKEIEAIRMIQTGVIDMTTTSALLSNWTEIMTFCEMPFLMDSMEDADDMLTGPVGARIRSEDGYRRRGSDRSGIFRRVRVTSPLTGPSAIPMICRG